MFLFVFLNVSHFSLKWLVLKKHKKVTVMKITFELHFEEKLTFCEISIVDVLIKIGLFKNCECWVKYFVFNYEVADSICNSKL